MFKNVPGAPAYIPEKLLKTAVLPDLQQISTLDVKKIQSDAFCLVM